MTKETNQTVRHRFRGGDCGCRPFMDSVLVGGGGSAHSQWERTAATPGSDALPGSGPGSRSGPGPVRPRPTMEAWVRFSAQSQARERLLRCSLGFRGPAGSRGGPAQGGHGGSEGAVTGAARITESAGRRITEALEPEEGGSRGSQSPGAAGGPSRMP